MKAVIEINKKQYIIDEGSILYVDYINSEIGSLLNFEKVLYFDGDIGRPYLTNCKVVAKVLKHGKQKKIIVLHHIPKKHHVTRHGHRQSYTKLEITKISRGEKNDTT